MKRKIFYLLPFIIISGLFIIIIGISLKIFLFSRQQVKGIQYEVHLNKDDFIFGTSKKLRYFYEPKPNSIEENKQPWSEKIIVNSINSDGLNETQEYTIEKLKDTFRIVTIGDSFTYGLYVETRNNYSKVLEKLLNDNLKCNGIKNFEVINLGVPGYDVEYIIERLKVRGTKYNPDLVIWLLNEWNFERISEYMNPLIDQLRNQGNAEFYVKKGEYNLIYNEALKKIQTEHSKSDLEKYQITVFFSLPNIFNGDLLIASFPSRLKKYLNVINELIKNNPTFTYYDGLPNFWSIQSYHFPDDHPNEKGHNAIAAELFSYLTNEKLKNCIRENGT